MNFAKCSLRRMGLASTAVGAFLFAWPAAQPAFAQSLNIPGLDGFANSVGGAISGLWSKKDNDDGSGGAIDYRPRPALVVPPAYTLPPPQTHVARTPNWPKDPDAVALRRARQDSRRPVPSADAVSHDSDPDDDASQDSGAAPTQAAAVSQGDAGAQKGTPMSCSNVAGTPVCVSQLVPKLDLPSLSGVPGLNLIPGLGGKDKDKDEDSAQNIHLNPNPTRKYLTDPPVDYLEAVQVPPKGEDDKASGADDSKQKIERAPPAVDQTPPGK